MLLFKAISKPKGPSRQETAQMHCNYLCAPEAQAKWNGCKEPPAEEGGGKACFCMSGDQCNKVGCSEAGLASIKAEKPNGEGSADGSSKMLAMGWMNALAALCALAAKV